MPLIAKQKTKSAVPPLEGGTYIAVCVGVIDLGEQSNEKYKNYSNKVLMIFEIPSETVDVEGEQKPRWLSREFTVSLNEKSNLAKTLVPWLGRELTEQEEKDGFDLSVMLGKSCQLQVIIASKEDRQYNNITAIIGLPKGFPSPTATSEMLLFDIYDWSDDTFAKLPEWIQEKIKKSTEYRTRSTGTDTLEFPEDTHKPESPKSETERVAPF